MLELFSFLESQLVPFNCHPTLSRKTNNKNKKEATCANVMSQFCHSLTMLLSHQYFRFRTRLGSVAAVQHLLYRAALYPATLWRHVWHLTPTLPVGCLIFWACRVPAVTWDRLTWAACLEALLACLQASTPTISTWTLTASPPVLLLCVWRPKSTVQPYLGQHEVLIPGGWGTLLTPELSRRTQHGVRRH